jgi:hypothetical protein
VGIRPQQISERNDTFSMPDVRHLLYVQRYAGDVR